MDKPKLVGYDPSLEIDIEVTDQIVDNLDEVETQNAVETEYQPDTNLISMKDIMPDKIFINIPVIIRNEKRKFNNTFERFLKVANDKG